MGSSSVTKRQQSSSNSPNNTLKCVIVGDGAVGKTCLLITYSSGIFPADYVPTIFDNYVVNVMVGSDTWTLCLFDTAGQEDYDKLRPLSYPQSDIVLICFSVVNPASFENLSEKWIPEIKKHCQGTPFIIVGTQSDLRDDPTVLRKLQNMRMQPVTEEEGHKLARRMHAIKYMECSAKTMKNVKAVFDEAVFAVVCPEDGKSKCAIA